MSTPKHRTVPGNSYFVTTKCWQGRQIFQVPETAEILLRTLFDYRDQEAYSLHEFVLMPDHLHVLLTPSGATSLEKAMQLIKGGSSHRIHKERNHKMEIWQQGFYDWTIRDSADWHTKVEYIHMNPVRAKLVQHPENWPYSSACGRFSLDPMPLRFAKSASGAKALSRGSLTQGLKPLPAEEETTSGPKGRPPGAAANVTDTSGAKAPFKALTMQGLKPLPPKEKSLTADSLAGTTASNSPGVGPKGPTPNTISRAAKA